MKPIIIPRDKVLEVLLKGYEVLHIEYHYKNNPKVTKLTSISIVGVMTVIEPSKLSTSDFFVAIVESEEDIPADPPTGEQPEVPSEDIKEGELDV